MDRADVRELHYIAPISNLCSILSDGILSHRRADAVAHDSVAMAEIQERRKDKPVPGGRHKLHDYVNLYFDARNPMMYRLSGQHGSLCVLAVDSAVLDLPNVVIADGNAASDYTAFWASPSGLARLNRDLVFAEYWTDPNPILMMRKKSAKCAEVLVPDIVPVRYIVGAYSSCQEATQAVGQASGGRLAARVHAHMFFR